MAKGLRNISSILFSALFGLVLFCLLQVTGEKYFIALLLLVPFLLLAFFIVTHADSVESRLRGFTYGKAWILIQIPGILIILVAFFTNKIEPSWDWGTTIAIAIQYVKSGTTNSMQYVATYQNNQFWIFALIYFFKIVRRLYPLADTAVYETALWILNAVLAVAAVNLIYFSAKKLFSEKRAFFTGALAALFLPIFLYVQITYTDIPGLFLCALMLYFYCALRKADGKKQILFLILLSATAALSYRVKVLVFILFLAIIVEGILNLRKKHLKRAIAGSIIAIVTFMAVFSLSGQITTETLGITEEADYEYRLPLTHWVMMGLKGNGGYNSKDYNYTISIPGYQEKLEATISKIEKRIEKKGFSGMMEHLLYTKVRRTWCNCMLGSDDYTERSPIQETSLFRDLITKDGSNSMPVHVVQSMYYIMVMLGVFVSGIASLTKKRTDLQGSVLSACRIALIGFFIFESIWECNSRYLICFLPVLFMVSGDGLYQIVSLLTGWRKREVKSDDSTIGDSGSVL